MMHDFHSDIDLTYKYDHNNQLIELQNFNVFNPTPVRGVYTTPPCRKMAITPKNIDPTEPKLRDFSYISIKNPPIPFLVLKMAKKGVSKAFLL